MYYGWSNFFPVQISLPLLVVVSMAVLILAGLGIWLKPVSHCFSS